MSDEVVTLASFVAIFIKCRDEHHGAAPLCCVRLGRYRYETSKPLSKKTVEIGSKSDLLIGILAWAATLTQSLTLR